MKATREELIEKAKKYFDRINTPASLKSRYDASVFAADFCLEINSEAGNETPTVTDNEAEKEFCHICGRLKVLKSEHLCADCFDQIP